MEGEWRETTLGEICDFRAGSVFPPAMQGKPVGKYPFIKVSDMNLSANAVRIREANNWLDDNEVLEIKARPFPCGTTVFAKIGEALKANRLRFIEQETIIDNNMMGAIPNIELIDAQFLFYALAQFDFGSIASGTALPYLTQGNLEKLEITLPPLEEQRTIAHILGTLDDKIELNRRMNQTLEAMARALFKSWFEDFDGIPAEDMQESELGLIPKGWRIGSIEDLCASITSGGTPARKNPEFWDRGTIPWFKTGELQDGPLLDSEEKITEAALRNSSCKLWPSGTILFALYASPTVGRLGIL